MASDINNIAKFLALRNINELSPEDLFNSYGIDKVDMILVLGGSMPYIANFGAKAYKNGLSREIMIAGGIGHSTKYLVENVLKEDKYRHIDVENRPEADILRDIIVRVENVDADVVIIENQSTNCGANARESLKVLKREGRVPKSVILIQDPPMQLRTHASFLKEWHAEDTLIISYSPFIPEIMLTESGISFLNDNIEGLWSVDRFIDLIMGEIPRLRDDENGYGPRGKGFIDHVDIPEVIADSYGRLLANYSEYSQIKDRK
jgi:uncharacterized SAM-binding protein YcdF (DUF218 family)